MENLEQFSRAMGTAVQYYPAEIRAILKRNGVFTPDNADTATLTRVTAAALGTSAAFRKDMGAWAASKARSYSNMAGWSNVDGDPVTGSAVTPQAQTQTSGNNAAWLQAGLNLLSTGVSAWGDTTAARYNAEAAAEYARAQQQQNQQSGQSAPPPQAGFPVGKVLLVVALVGVVGGTIWYFTKKK
jgi:hypothetical protein